MKETQQKNKKKKKNGKKKIMINNIKMVKRKNLLKLGKIIWEDH